MKNFVIVTLVLISLSLSGQVDRSERPKAGPAPTIEIGNHYAFSLDNGLQCFLVENHKLPRVSFSLTVDAPIEQEGKLSGLGSIAGELLMGGTSSMSKLEIDEAVDYLGASLASSSSGVYASSLSRHSSAVFDLMAMVLLTPSFPESELEKIKKQHLSSLESEKENASAIANKLGRILRYGKDHPYGETESTESIALITTADCRAFYERRFIPNQSYLIIVGDLSPERCEKMVRERLSKWKKGETIKAASFPVVSPEETEVYLIDMPDAEQSVVQLTYPISLQPGTDDVIPAYLCNQVLGGGNFTARLFQNLREEHAYTYGAFSRIKSDRSCGYFSAQSDVRNEVTDSAIVEMRYEMDRLRSELLEEADLQLVKNIVSGDFARSLESPGTLARFALNKERYGLDDNYYRDYLTKVAAVSPAKIQEMAVKYIRPEKARIVVVGVADELREKLKKFSPTGTVIELDSEGNEVVDNPIAKVWNDLKKGKQMVSVHRAGGFEKNCAENSLLCLQQLVAKMDGHFMVEADVRKTKDNVLVMLHDESLDRTTSGSGDLSDYNYPNLHGSFLEDNEGNAIRETIPRFETFLNSVKGNCLFAVDIKNVADIPAIVSMIKKTKTTEECVLIAYTVDVAQKIHEQDPALKISCTIRNAEELQRHLDAGIPKENMLAFTGTKAPSIDLIQLLDEQGIISIVGTMGNLDRSASTKGESVYQKLLAMGIDILSTDRPYEAAAAIEGMAH